MASNAFSISGLEEIDGVLYARSWYCRHDEKWIVFGRQDAGDRLLKSS